MAKENSLGAKILELIPEELREDLLKEVKRVLIETGEVIEAPEATKEADSKQVS